jgi:uncharacterized membrane protein
MPLGTTFTFAQVLILFPALIVAVLKGPETPDVYAVLGAVCATAIVVLDSKYKTRKQTISLILGCGSVGSIAPGLVVHFGVPHLYDSLIWQAWAGLGLVFGGFGYALISLIWLVVGRRAGEIVEEQVSHYTGKTKPVRIKPPRQPNDDD